MTCTRRMIRFFQPNPYNLGDDVVELDEANAAALEADLELPADRVLRQRYVEGVYRHGLATAARVPTYIVRSAHAV